MDFLIYALPIVIVLVTIVRQAWQIWRDGLFVALVQLGITIAAAFLAFFLTRLLLDPAKVDLFGLGALLLSIVPQDFIIIMPKLEAFVQALPTALLALIGFTVIFDVLRINAGKLLHKLNAKHKWSEKLLKVKGEQLLTIATGLLIAAVCITPDLITISGTLTFSGNLLYCARTATGQEIFSSVGDVVHRLQESPLIILCNQLGAQDIYYELTSASRDGESFSVGEELNQLSESFVGVLPIYETLNRTDEPPSPEQIRALPSVLSSTQDTLALTVGLARSYREELGGSDAIMIISSLIGTTPARFEEYLSQLTMDTAEEDLETFCEVAAKLADRELIPESGGTFDLNALADPALLEEVRQEIVKNKKLATFFDVGEDTALRAFPH